MVFVSAKIRKVGQSAKRKIIFVLHFHTFMLPLAPQTHRNRMEYVVSARKYRPLTFDSVVGQTTLTTTLKNAIRSERLAHAYLFSGPRGVGKTTCARIFARTINCSQPTPEGEACGECENCRAFLEGRSYNIFELDAASNNSVDDIRALSDQTRIPPQIGKYKVFIVDEVHMLSAQAFNAFLKTLEEPPSYVIFILATTEKHKLLPTIISRCQIYDFDRITVQSIVDHLKMVAQKEGYTCEEEALNIIAEKADGAMRDALSTFDQVASFCQGNITYAKTIEDLNVLDVENYFRIVDFSLENKVTDVLLLLNDVINRGFDPGNTCQGLARHLRDVLMAREQQTLQLLDASAQQKARLAEQAKRCPPSFLFRALKILNNCETSYRTSSNKRLLVELSLIEIAQITQGDEETPPSGPGPKRLKNLHFGPSFSGKTPTSQSAPAEPSVSPKEPTPNATAPRATPPAPSAQFTQEDLEREWKLMCQQMKRDPELDRFAPRLTNLRPTITDFPQVELVAGSSSLHDSLKKIHDRLLQMLVRALSNDSITLSLRMATPSEFKPVPSRAEQAEQMRKSNPGMELLFQKLDLQLS